MINPADDPIFAICAVAAAIFIGLSKGGVPVIGMLGVPVLALVISPLRAAALLLPIYVVTDMFGLWAYRRQFSRRNLDILVPAAILGIAIGWMTATIVPEALVALIVGLIGVGYCLDLWLKRKRSASPREADIPRGLFWRAHRLHEFRIAFRRAALSDVCHAAAAAEAGFRRHIDDPVCHRQSGQASPLLGAGSTHHG